MELYNLEYEYRLKNNIETLEPTLDMLGRISYWQNRFFDELNVMFLLRDIFRKNAQYLPVFLEINTMPNSETALLKIKKLQETLEPFIEI